MQYFSHLVEIERKGYAIWSDSLPNLSIEIIKNGYYHDFILVDKNSRLVNKNIEIKNHFVIPSGETNISFALKYADERSGYRAILKSPDLPYLHDVECELLLTYDYEAESPYKLIYKPLDTTLKSIEVQWTKSKNNFLELPTPQYPPRKTWDDLKRFESNKSKTGEHMNLLELLEKELNKLNDIEIKSYDKNVYDGYFEYKFINKKNTLCCFINVNGKKILCHQNDFLSDISINNLKKGDCLYLIINGGIGSCISFDNKTTKITSKEVIEECKKNDFEKLSKKLNFLQFLIFTIWRDHCLDEEETPIIFKSKIKESLKNISNFYGRSDLDDFIKNRVTFILSGMHIDIPDYISNIFVRYSKNIDNLKDNIVVCLALAVGNCDVEWQKVIFQNILLEATHNPKNIYAYILGKIFWRSKKIIEQIDKKHALKILELLLKVLREKQKQINTCEDRLQDKLFSEITQGFELLLAMLRLRNSFHILLPADDNTNEFISIVDFFVEQCRLGKYKLKSYLEFEINKPKDFENIPDLLYALRIFLMGDIEVSKGIKILSVSEEQD